MLDLSHLMITNQDLKTEEEAARYIVDVVNNLGEMKKHILGVHINKSLPGDYMKEDHFQRLSEYLDCEDSLEKYFKTMNHIKNIDWHVPFEDDILKDVIKVINPKYKVYEVLTQTKEQLDDYIKIQNKAMGR